MTSLIFVMMISVSLCQGQSGTDPVTSFKKWGDEVDSLADSLATKNKASAELIIQVYNSNNKQAKGFLGDQMKLFASQKKDVDSYYTALKGQIDSGVARWNGDMQKGNVDESTVKMAQKYFQSQSDMILKKAQVLQTEQNTFFTNMNGILSKLQ